MKARGARWRLLYPLLLATFVVCGALTGWIIADLRDEVRRVHDQSKADAWYLHQAMFELERFMHAFSAHVAGIESVDYQTVLVRFDIFWSRIPVISEGDSEKLTLTRVTSSRPRPWRAKSRCRSSAPTSRPTCTGWSRSART